MARRRTQEEFIAELTDKNPKIQPLEPYINSRTKILCKCEICKKEWRVKPDSVLSGHGCPVCNSLKKTHEDFKAELHITCPNIELLSEYKTNKTKVKIRHLDCGHIEYKLPNELKRRGCYMCCKTAKLSERDFEKRVFKVNPHIKLLSPYINSQTNILCKCLKDGYEWYASPYYLSHIKNVCPRCSQVVKHTQESVNARMSDRKIRLLDKCEGVHNKYNFQCLKCNCIWNAELNSVLNNNAGCPRCNRSLGENLIEYYLVNHKIDFCGQYTFDDLFGVSDVRNLSYDFYLPDFNLLIEYQGKQHYTPIDYFGGEEHFNIQVEHDKRKREYAKKNNIDLLEIPYTEFDNIESILCEKLNIVNNN